MRESLDNWLRFLALCRGSLESRRHGYDLESEDPEFRLRIALRPPDAQTPRRLRYLYLADALPQPEDKPEARLVLAWMDVARLAAHSPRDVPLCRVQSSADLDRFTAIQARSFLEPGDAAGFRHWYRFLRQRNAAVLDRDDVAFVLVGEGDGSGTVQTVSQGEVIGFYAVASDHGCRRRGLASAAMVGLARRALARGARLAVLQVMEGSPAEGLYRKLGFEMAPGFRIYRRCPA